MSHRVAFVWDDALRHYDFGPGHPLAPVRVQLAYRALRQIVRDLGATSFDISTGGDSFKLSQLRAAAEKDLAEAKAEVMDRFGTLGVVPAEGSSPFVSIDLNYLNDLCEVN